MQLSVDSNDILMPLSDVSELDKMRPLPQFYNDSFVHMHQQMFLFVVYQDKEDVTLLVGAENAAHDVSLMLTVIEKVTQDYREVSQIVTLPQADVKSVILDIKDSLTGLGKVVGKGEIPRAHLLFTETIIRALEVGAQDIHLKLYRAENRAYADYKVDGEFLTSARKSFTGYNDAFKMLRATYDVYGDKEGGGDLDERSAQDTTFHYEVAMEDGIKRREKFRLTKTVAENGDLIYTVIRKLGEQSRTLDELGLTDAEAKIIRKCFQSALGMIVTSGPTGSGKSSTLMAGVREFPATKSLQTLEDPIEIKLALDHVVQNQLQGNDFSAQMDSMLRQDIDGMMVGEVRNAETLSLSMAFAGSGHLCATTTHANTPMEIIERFKTLGATAAELANPSLLKLLMGQRLESKICRHCKIPIVDSDALAKTSLTLLNINFMPNTLFRRNEHGCNDCHHTGVSGRQLVLEIIQVDDIDRGFIRTADYPGWKTHLKSKGHLTLLDKSRILVEQGDACPIIIESRYGGELR